MILPPYPPSVTLPPDTDEIPAPAAARTSRLAITALATAAAGLVVLAPAFAVAALLRARRRAEKGSGLALAALALSLAWSVAAAALLVTTGGGEDARTRETGEPRASTLEVGDCFEGFRQEGPKIFARAVPCTAVHQGEILAEPKLAMRSYPGEERLAAEAKKVCREQASSLYAAGHGGDFLLHADRPGEAAWERGERRVTCLLRYADGAKSFVMKDAPKSEAQLVAGDCLERWSETVSLRVVDCATPHGAQVFAKLTPGGGEYPDAAAALARCSERARGVIGSDGPRDLLVRYAVPEEREWVLGERYVACLVLRKEGLLTRSLVVE